MDHSLALKLRIPLRPLTHKIEVHALNGQDLPHISHDTGPVTLVTSGNHTERLSFYILDSPLAVHRFRTPLAHKTQPQNRLATGGQCWSGALSVMSLVLCLPVRLFLFLCFRRKL